MNRPRIRRRMPFQGVLGALLLLTAALLAGPARATVELRVEALPISDPIEAFVTVTDANGDPVGGLAAGDFTVTLDGVAIALASFTLPPAQDPNQRVSVVFVMDYSPSIQGGALTDMENSVISFINAMNIGDFAAIVKFNDTNPARASVVLPFTAIDGGAGTNMLISAVMSPYPGVGTNLLDAVNLAVDQFAAPPVALPLGPKAVIAVSDGGENQSNVDESTVLANANANGIAVFTIGQGDVAGQNGLQLLTELAAQTGGDYLPAPTPAEITAAYATISLLLNNEYLLTIPASSVTDCGQHTIEVTVTGQAAPASVSFIRCDVTPDAFSFTNQASVAPNTVVTSNSITISGVETSVAISVAGGGYSIGCNGTFTTSAGTIDNGQTVCVRHTASASFSTDQVTTLTVGGVSGAFTSTTTAAPPPPAQGGGGGGGGAMGIAELLLGLGALAARRRRRPA